jgi:hypothetical protein
MYENKGSALQVWKQGSYAQGSYDLQPEISYRGNGGGGTSFCESKETANHADFATYFQLSGLCEITGNRRRDFKNSKRLQDGKETTAS